MLKYGINVSQKTFEFFIVEWLKTDSKVPSAKNFKGSQWFKPLEDEINEIEPQISSSTSKSRLNEDSKRAGPYLSINANCKVCDAKYLIKLESKPNVEDKELTFKVERNTVHNQDLHSISFQKTTQVRGDGREALAS